jgi:predicted SprT family Zn-dependent metalloprotease
MNTHEVETIIREALDKVAPGCPSPQILYTRAYNYCGRAEIGYGFTRVKLSKSWVGATPEGQRQTLIHEAMHLADAFLNGRVSGHGLPWKALMWTVGARPDRCSNDPGAVATANQAAWSRATWIHCPCRSHRVSKQMRTAIAKRPGSKLCARCHSPFTIAPHPEVKAA